MTTNDFDPTKNRVPYGLLTPEEQGALKAQPHGWEFYSSAGQWNDIAIPFWADCAVYRGKPAPVVTSKWFNVYPEAASLVDNSTREGADKYTGVKRIAVLRIDTCNGVSTAHLEGV
jgi:hypothetical protein